MGMFFTFKNKTIVYTAVISLSVLLIFNIAVTPFFNAPQIKQNNSAESAIFEGSVSPSPVYFNISKIENKSLSQIDNLTGFNKNQNKISNLKLKFINNTTIKDFHGSAKFQAFITSHFSTST